MKFSILHALILTACLSACAAGIGRDLTSAEEEMFAAMPVQLSPKARKFFIETYLNKPGAKAYAASADGGGGYQSGAHDKADAEKMAVNRTCPYYKESGNQPCQIVHSAESASPPLENGIRLSDNTFDLYQTYLTESDPKIFMIGYGGVAGYGYAATTKEAEQHANTMCINSMRARDFVDDCIALDINGVLQDIEQPAWPGQP